MPEAREPIVLAFSLDAEDAELEQNSGPDEISQVEAVAATDSSTCKKSAWEMLEEIPDPSENESEEECSPKRPRRGPLSGPSDPPPVIVIDLDD